MCTDAHVYEPVLIPRCKIHVDEETSIGQTISYGIDFNIPRNAYTLFRRVGSAVKLEAIMVSVVIRDRYIFPFFVCKRLCICFMKPRTISIIRHIRIFSRFKYIYVYVPIVHKMKKAIGLLTSFNLTLSCDNRHFLSHVIFFYVE